MFSQSFNSPSTSKNYCFVDELPDEVKGLEILNSVNGLGSSDPKLPATLTNQVLLIPVDTIYILSGSSFNQ